MCVSVGVGFTLAGGRGHTTDHLVELQHLSQHMLAVVWVCVCYDCACVCAPSVHQSVFNVIVLFFFFRSHFGTNGEEVQK
jgi:hypothetical protein